MGFLPACMLIQRALTGAVGSRWARGEEGGRGREKPAQAPARAHHSLPFASPAEGEGPLLSVAFSWVGKVGREGNVRWPPRGLDVCPV